MVFSPKVYFFYNDLFKELAIDMNEKRVVSMSSIYSDLRNITQDAAAQSLFIARRNFYKKTFIWATTQLTKTALIILLKMFLIGLQALIVCSAFHLMQRYAMEKATCS